MIQKTVWFIHTVFCLNDIGPALPEILPCIKFLMKKIERGELFIIDPTWLAHACFEAKAPIYVRQDTGRPPGKRPLKPSA